MCPICKDALSSVANLAQAFSWSVLLMLGVPILVVAVITTVIIRAHRRTTKQ